MIRFLHEVTRLYTHTTRAYKIFTNEKELSKWHDEAYQVDFSVGGAFEVTQNVNKQKIRSIGSTFEAFEREALLVIKWKDDFCFQSEGSSVEIRIMSATSETEYCTEIHVVHKGLEQLEDEVVNIYIMFWRQLLESVRQSVNGDWIIQDSELTLDCFK